MSHKIITIARQFGSGGHEVAQRLSDQLGIPLYDRNLVEMAAERMGHSPVSIEKADESALSSFLAGYQIPKEPNSVTGYGLSLNDSTYVTQTIIIEALAQKGPCVIVGRCGDYVLRSHPDLIDVFICADMEDRVRRIMDRYSFQRGMLSTPSSPRIAAAKTITKTTPNANGAALSPTRCCLTSASLAWTRP